MRDLRESTSYETIGCQRHCSYCGEVMKEDYDYEEYERITTTFCNCEGANLEVEANKILAKAKAKINHKKLNKLKFDVEVQQLKNRYGIK